MSDGTREATVNPDGSTTFEDEAGSAEGGDAPPLDENGDMGGEEEFAGGGMPEEGTKTDPGIFLLVAVLLLAGLCFLVWYRRRKAEKEQDAFFSNLDGEKFNLKLPAAVDEYYEIKAKCEEAGWEPGQKPAGTDASAPQKVMAQALMKRCIADIPIVQHIQNESAGMNKLYSQSMCSVKQWRAYQAAEAMVSAEVDEVRAEADEIEPGWSQVIWRQAMQYHNMLKQRHEMEAKAANAQAEKKKLEDEKVEAAKRKEDEAKARELAAEKAAEELIKAEEREAQSKKSFAGGSMKKGFLATGGKKK